MRDDLAGRVWKALLPEGPRPRPTWRGQLFDAVFALVLLLAGFEYISDLAEFGHSMPPAGYVLVLLAVCGLLAVRRWYPLTVLWLVFLLGLTVVAGTPRVMYYASVIAAYTAARYSPYRLPAITSVAMLTLLAWNFTRDGMRTVPEQYVGSMVLAIVVLSGLSLRLWRSRAEESQQRLASAEREREEALRRAVESERSRIARELHDVVTHNVSVMVIQAGAARRVMDTAPGQAREALLAVEASGRTAMAELRHVMGLLAAPPDGGCELEPQPGLGQIAALVGRVRDTGMTVDLAVTGTPRPVPDGQGLAAYRVVQEALTNAVKHAPGTSVTVNVHYGGSAVRIEVTDTGSSTPGGPGNGGGSGSGLLGLRERLAVYGGTLRAGRQLVGSGYRVSATIPVEAS
ncbi:sensor histidine kinase [Longispora albida]|uniref:sensor histidine kinase n=1 Tax=Longispora albida TaxID=203523 RepID=UPI00037AF9C6|nr:histidine kinase [Longispora albida]